ARIGKGRVEEQSRGGRRHSYDGEGIGCLDEPAPRLLGDVQEKVEAEATRCKQADELELLCRDGLVHAFGGEGEGTAERRECKRAGEPGEGDVLALPAQRVERPVVDGDIRADPGDREE